LWSRLAIRPHSGLDSSGSSGKSAPALRGQMGLPEQRRLGDFGHPSAVPYTLQREGTPDKVPSRVPEELHGWATASSPSKRDRRLRTEGRSLSPGGQPRPGILFPGLPGSQTVQSRPTSTQPVYSGGLVQDGVNSISLALRRGEWATSVDLADAYLHIPMHPLSWRYLRFALRPGNSTVLLHASDENGVVMLPSRGTAVPRVPRLFTVPGQQPATVSMTGGVYNVTLTLPRLLDRQEGRADTLPGIHFPGVDVQSSERYGLPCPTQIAGFSSITRHIDESHGCNAKGSPQASRPYGILLSPLPGGESGSTRATVAAVVEMGQQPLGRDDPYHYVVTGHSETMVAGGLSGTDKPSPPAPAHADTIYRCLQHGLGRPFRRTPGLGEVGAAGTLTSSRWRLSIGQ